MEKRCEEEVKKKDMKIILELDQKAMDQQVMLEKAGVPGFYVTNKGIDLRLQMYLLEFITRLGHMQSPCQKLRTLGSHDSLSNLTFLWALHVPWVLYNST